MSGERLKVYSTLRGWPRHALGVVGALVAVWAPAAAAQVADRPAQVSADREDPAEQGEDIVVVAPRPDASVPGATPELVLDEHDIGAYGASTVGEVIDSLDATTGGPPIILMNGRPASRSELASLPPEALRRMEVFSPDVAARLGYPPNQRVLNVVVRDNFQTTTVELHAGNVSHGHGPRSALSLADHRLSPGWRQSVSGKIEARDGFTRAEAGARAPSGIDDRAFHTAAPDSLMGELEGVWNRRFASSMNAVITANVTASESEGLASTDADGDAIRTANTSNVNRLGLTLRGTHARTTRWDVSARMLDQASRAEIFSTTPTRTDNETRTYDLSAGANGRLFEVDGSPSNWGLQALYSVTEIAGHTRSSTGHTTTHNTKTGASLNATSTVPIISRESVLGAMLGDVGILVSSGVEAQEGFDPTTTYAAGINWRPIENLHVTVQRGHSERTPDVNQLHAAPVQTPGVSVFDPATGEDALVTVTTGGNPALATEESRSLNVSASWSPSFLENLLLRMTYERSNVRNALSAFPDLSPAVETAFSDRVTRDGDGNLIGIDRRPVNFAERNSASLRMMMSLRRRAAFIVRDGAPDQAEGGADEPGARRRGGRGGEGFDVTLSYIRRLEDEVVLASGMAPIDLLQGASLGGESGGATRVVLEGGVNWRGLGLRLNGAWTDGYEVRGATRAEDLEFSDVASLNMRAFFNFDARPELVAAWPFLEDARLSLQLDNLLDQTRRVRDADGQTPVAYQRALTAPDGRSWRVSFRKSF